MYAVLTEEFGRSGETAVAEGIKVVICLKTILFQARQSSTATAKPRCCDRVGPISETCS